MRSPRKRWRKVAVAALVVAGLAGLAVVALRAALDRVPGFYAAALALPAVEQAAAGEELERNIVAIHNEVRDRHRWSAVFTEAQVNGWLAADLPEKFPHMLPPDLHDPRVAFRPNQLQIACQYGRPSGTRVVSLTLEVQLGEEPNTLAVRIRGARAGWVPLPLRPLLDRVTEAVQFGELPIRWVQSAGDPVALITIADPDSGDGDAGVGDPRDGAPQFVLEHIEIRAGQLHLAGRAGAPDAAHPARASTGPDR